jgi:hypothetical protein
MGSMDTGRVHKGGQMDIGRISQSRLMDAGGYGSSDLQLDTSTEITKVN